MARKVRILLLPKNQTQQTGSGTSGSGSGTSGSGSGTSGSGSGSGTQQTQQKGRIRTTDKYAIVSEAFVTAFNLQEAAAPTEPISYTRGTQTYWKIPSAGSRFSSSYTFWKKNTDGSIKKYQAIMSDLRVYEVAQFARSLQNCVAFTTPRGVTYHFKQTTSS